MDVSFFPEDNDFASDINETLLNNIAASQPNIFTSFDHVELPINLNDAVNVNNEVENSRNLETVQGIGDDAASNITDNSYERDDFDAPYVPEGSNFDNSFANEDNSEGRGEAPFDSSLNETKTRKKRKISENWNYNKV